MLCAFPKWTLFGFSMFILFFLVCLVVLPFVFVLVVWLGRYNPLVPASIMNINIQKNKKFGYEQKQCQMLDS